MKRIIFIFAAAALLSQAALVFAQDSGEPSEQSVLDAARAKYWQDKAPQAASDSTDAPSQPDEPASEAVAAHDHVPYTPVLISFVPGISFPFGYYDTSLAAGAIGTLARDISGAEGSGVFNVARDVRGVQWAGVFNISRNMLGLQDAGVFNIVDGDVTGLQGAGVFNITGGKVVGFQAAGVFNISHEVLAPLQAAGVFNIADEVRGFQAAGIFNVAGRVAGGQAAGIFNKADRVSGVQIGLVNVAGYIDGVQIGLVNIAGNGVDSLGVTYEPASDFWYAHWQAGTPAFYTVAGIGAPSAAWFTDWTRFVVSFGAGSRTRLFGLNIDLDVSAVQPLSALPSDRASWENCDWSMRDRFIPYPSVRLMAGLPLGRHFQIVGGIKADIDVDAWGDRVPDALRVGEGMQGRIFDEGFTVWPKWFLGVKI